MKEETMPALPHTTAIDWDKINRRLESVRAAIGHEFVPTEREKKEILKTRAKTLARRVGREEVTAEFLEVVVFRLATETYALELAYIREVYSLKEITPLPCIPPFVKGIINVRGQIFSVVDLKGFFDLPDTDPDDLNKVIIIHTDKMEFSVLVDAILGVQSILGQEIQPPPPTLTGIQADYVKGVTNELLIILDAAKILADQRIIVNEEVAG